MFHVPTDDTWDAESIAEMLRHRELDAYTVNDAVRIKLPRTLSDSIIGKLFWKLFRPSPMIIVISYFPKRFIRNVDLDYDVMKLPMDCPVFGRIADAMRHCGYLAGDDREIATRYVHDSTELDELFNDIDELEIQKLNLVHKQDFEGAAIVCDKEEMIRREADAMLFKLVGRSAPTEKPGEP